LIDGREEVFGQGGDEGDEGVEMRGCVFGVEAAEEVAVVVISLGKDGRERRLVTAHCQIDRLLPFLLWCWGIHGRDEGRNL